MRRFNSRTVHRYLAIVIGIQLLFWTTSGLIFSWNSIKVVRGEDLVREGDALDLKNVETLSLHELCTRNETELVGVELENVVLRTMLDKPVFELTICRTEAAGPHYILLDAISGKKLSPLPKELATRIAQQDFSETADVKLAELIVDEVSSHSEYRGKELPVWRVTLDHPTGTVIYVSADRGIVMARRNHRWRLFDFFWMLHTMDYQGRDNFNSWLLRIASVLGVVTVLSGYWLWWRTTRVFRLTRVKSRSKNRSTIE